MNYNDIENNINLIKIGKIETIENNIIKIGILYNNEELNIKIPEKKGKYFELHNFNDDSFYYKHYLTLDLRMRIDDFEEEYKNQNEKILTQKEAVKFNKFIITLKNIMIKKFIYELKNNDYLNMVDFKEINLESDEIDMSIWDETIDFSFFPEIKEVNDETIIETIFRNYFHLNKKTKKDKNFILKCNIVFINKRLEDKKHIYINWFII
jgi:hypothetical protein